MMAWFHILGWFPSIVAVLGNALVVVIIASRPRLHNPSNWFVLSLALADFAVGLIYFPTAFFCGKLALCKSTIAHDIALLAMFSSVTNLCVMTSDRYIAIIKPLRYVTWMTSRRASVLIALGWGIPLTLDFIPALCSRLGKCDLQNKDLVISKVILLEIIPCLFLLITTTQMVTAARRHCRQDALLDSQLQHNQPNRRRTRDFSATRVITIVVTIFLACYCVELFSVVRFLAYSSTPTVEVIKVIYFLTVVNSAANPIAYSLFKRDIRKELRKILRLKKVVSRPRQASASTAV